MATASPQSRVLATANREIGYSRWNDPKNGTKYARETMPVFWPGQTWLTANGVSYCDIFITWVFWKALGEDFVKKGYLPAGASYNTDYRASKGGRVSKPPKPGDVLVFDWNWRTASTNHVGILEKVLPSGNYQTIEGNTSAGSSGSQSNGGRVARRTRKPGQVKYVIRPNWSKAGGSSAPSKSKNVWDTSPRIKGMSKTEVKSIQTLLVGAGYSVGKSGIDGSYKGDTVSAVKKAQKALKLSVDGVAGPATVAALKKAQKSTSKPKVPTFPLPKGYYYGDPAGPIQSVSGKTKNSKAPKDVVQDKSGKWYSKGLKQAQAKLGVVADGRWGPKTAAAVLKLKKAKKGWTDDRLGTETWTLIFGG